jgi:FAD/FMN-containing dehydrogenase
VSSLAEALARVVGPENVLVDPGLKSSYEHDFTGRFAGESLLVVRPGDATEVATVLGVCAEAGVAVVPQGGHSGLVGGGTPCDGEVVLSLRRLDRIEELDQDAAQVTVGAGVILEVLQGYLRQRGLDFGVDHAGRGSATVGGMAATNAGGPLALRHGTMRAQIAGLEAVLADGRTVSRLDGLLKDNAGFDLPALLVGSEGTLAVITRLRLRVVPLLPARVVALVAVPDLARGLEILRRLRADAPSLHAVDYFHAHGLARVCERHGLPAPFATDDDVYLVVECAALHDPSRELGAIVDLAEHSAVASDAPGRARLWAYRELQNETLTALGVPHKLDVSVPISRLPAFERDVEAAVAGLAPDAELFLYGHLGDGNVHVNVVGPPPDDERVDDAVLGLVARHGGSISAEHGVGLAKTRWLGLSRTSDELAIMRDVKHALDPAGLLNPGRVLDVRPR